MLPKQHLEIQNKWSYSQQDSKLSFIEWDFSEVLFGAEGCTEGKLQPSSVLCHRQLSTCVYLTPVREHQAWGSSAAQFELNQLTVAMVSPRLICLKLSCSDCCSVRHHAGPELLPITVACQRKTVTEELATGKPALREDCIVGHLLPSHGLQRRHCNIKWHCGIQKF